LAASGQAERIETLFNRGYFLRTELYADYHHRTPAHFAAANGHFNVIKVLIQYGYQGLIHKDRWGYYPIHQARQNQFYHIVDQLVQLKL
jgi:ankyrin repeat protein